MSDISNLIGLDPKSRDLWNGQAQFNADQVLVVIERANVTQAASDEWSYNVPFKLVGEVTGEIIPFTGTIGAGATLSTGSGPVPAVGSATPAVTMGRGVAVVEAGNVGGGSYEATDVVTLTLTYTNLRGGTDTDTFTVTMT